MTPERKPFQPLTSSDVCEIYKLLYKQGLVAFPITQEAVRKVDSVIANITESHFSVEFYPTTEEKAVAHLYFLIKNHPFTDGNKRTASITFLTLCSLNDLAPDLNQIKLDQLAVYIEQLREQDHQRWIRVIAVGLFGGDFFASETTTL